MTTLTAVALVTNAISGHTASPSSELTPAQLLRLAQASTFEVVLPKIEPDYVKYEKPLPLELLSYRERTDKFWSIGTAFAIGSDTYVSAAHVLLSGLGSAMGAPALRDADGRTFPVEDVLKFSMHEDYIVFRARGASASSVLQPDVDPATGTNVYAVGNALGEGVVLRDGLLTSMTPEDQDGRWKWLRFSAAASPGNSGGPLLDTAGHVLGVVTMKSPGENLNYALPIARVLDGKSAAVFDVRSSFGVPILRQQLVTEFKDSFALPVKWQDFVRTLMERGNHQFDANQHRLLDEHAAELPPGGDSARLLAKLDTETVLGLIHQQADDTWEISEPENREETRLGGGNSLWTGTVPGAISFRLERPPHEAGNEIYHDDVRFMDTLLKGIKLPRAIGPQAIRITSLGAPRQRTSYKDRFNRVWQVRTWSLGYTDMSLVTFTLPTPEGYGGLLQVAQAAGYHDTLATLELLADYTHTTYRGSPSQWRTFLEERDLCPPFLSGVHIDQGAAVTAALQGLFVAVPSSVLATSEDSRLIVHVRYAVKEGVLRAEPDGITLDAGRGDDTSWIGIWSQPRPDEQAGQELADRWKAMSTRSGDFTGELNHSSDYTNFWTTSMVGDPADDVLYEVSLNVFERSLTPAQLRDRRDQLLGGLKPRRTSER